MILWSLIKMAKCFAVLVDPMQGSERVRQAIDNLWHSRYITLETKLVTVELTVYNPMLDHVCHVRLVAELTPAGGVITSHDMNILRLWTTFTASDSLYLGLTIVVATFYGYFVLRLQREIWTQGWAAVTLTFKFWLQIFNVGFFFIYIAFQ